MKPGYLRSCRRASALAALAMVAGTAALHGQIMIGPIPHHFPDPWEIRIAGSGSFLGVGVAEIDAERSKQLNLKEERGVEITRVEPGSPAEKAGLKVGDVVLEYQGQRVEGTEQFVRLVRETPPGRNVQMVISRNGTTSKVTAQIGTRQAIMIPREGDWVRVMPRGEFPEIVIPDVPKALMAWRSARLGIEAESIDSQLAEFFGVKEGVLVRSVIKDSAADRAGIRAGDVIVRVNDTKVATARDISAALRGLADKKTIPIVVVREKRETTLSVTVDEDASGSRRFGKGTARSTKL